MEKGEGRGRGGRKEGRGGGRDRGPSTYGKLSDSLSLPFFPFFLLPFPSMPPFPSCEFSNNHHWVRQNVGTCGRKGKEELVLMARGAWQASTEQGERWPMGDEYTFPETITFLADLTYLCYLKT